MAELFRPAATEDLDNIWNILQGAIQRRKEDGSEQWQDGYPNPSIVQADIDNNRGFVLTDGNEIMGYVAIFINDEPSYANIEGTWLTNEDFVAVHRVAISHKHLGKGLAKTILEQVETFAINHNIYSVKSDTNFDNPAMLHLFEKLGYKYCGEVYFRGKPRKAYEKVLR